ncbi:nitrate/nitrite transporter [Bacillus sp. EB600]|uniref:MFS transporter n=1 Tax=Bacillus sp. EB600 TaxID=2806345 RepID=UPI00210E9006|nr:MFS transporter [Bacillus sp. EB600]MCQ6282508.1 MFS transporter [Bacillus sp. EB600]
MEKKNSSYRWIVFGAVLFAYFLIVSQRTAPGLITDQLMKDFTITASMVGLMTSIQFFAYSGLQIPVGLLSDRFGPNGLLVIGTLLNGLGTVLYSAASNEYVLFLSRLMVGMGDATIWVNVVLILSQWFKAAEFIGLLGFAGMAGNLGSLLATVPFSAWISASGWRISFFTSGIALCLTSILLYFVLVLKPKQLFKNGSETKKPQTKKREKTVSILKRVITTRQAWATFFCHFGVMGTYVGFIGSWGVPFGMHIYDMSRSSASQLIMYGLFGAIIGGPLISWFTSKREMIKSTYLVIQLIIFLSWLTFFLFAGKPPLFLTVILFIATGFGSGAGSLTFAIVRKSFPLTEVGVITGFANTGGFISAVLLPFLFGYVLDHFHHAPVNVGYHYGFVIPVLFSFVAVIGGIMIKEQRNEQTQLSVQTNGR